jgi:hypothetical protein
MNEPAGQAPPPAPPPAPRPPAATRPEGSFALGYVGGGVAMLLVLLATGGMIAAAPTFSAAFLLLPPAAFVGLLVFAVGHGTRTRKGLLAMLLTFIGLLVLLIAACFGYFAIHPLNIH